MKIFLSFDLPFLLQVLYPQEKVKKDEDVICVKLFTIVLFSTSKSAQIFQRNTHTHTTVHKPDAGIWPTYTEAPKQHYTTVADTLEKWNALDLQQRKICRTMNKYREEQQMNM